MSARTAAAVLVKGVAEGEVIVLDEPLSFSGGLDSETGRITDRWHPQCGAVLSGKILSMESGRGSSSGSAVLAEALRRGTGPRGILLSRRDGIVSAGAIVANNLYGVGCPVVFLPREERLKFGNAMRLKIVAGGGDAVIDAC